MSRKKPTPIQSLMAAMDRYAEVAGEVKWTSGYRARAGLSPVEDDRLYRKQMQRSDAACRARFSVRRLAMRLLREARRTPARKSRA